MIIEHVFFSLVMQTYHESASCYSCDACISVALLPVLSVSEVARVGLIKQRQRWGQRRRWGLRGVYFLFFGCSGAPSIPDQPGQRAELDALIDLLKRYELLSDFWISLYCSAETCKICDNPKSCSVRDVLRSRNGTNWALKRWNSTADSRTHAQAEMWISLFRILDEDETRMIFSS